MLNENIYQLAPVIKDVILAGCAFVGAYVAVTGLGTWKRQIKGQTDFNLSRSLLGGLFKYRDAIKELRNPAIWADEMSLMHEETVGKTPQQIHFLGAMKAYKARWAPINSVRATMYADLVEAEALWGVELPRLFEVLYRLQHELYLSTSYYLESINPEISSETKRISFERSAKRRDCLYASLGDDDDDHFWKEFVNATKPIEDALRKKIKHD